MIYQKNPSLRKEIYEITFTYPPAQSFVTNGLVAYYPFNGNANDASGNGNNATTVQATLCADRFGNPNSAYSFNGTSSYIGFTNVPTTQVDNWTVTAWVQPASLSQGAIWVTVGYDAGSDTTGNGYAFGMLGANLNSPGNQLFVNFGGITRYLGGFTFTSINEWYQVVMLRNGGVTTLYVNGVLTSTNNITTTPRTPTAFTIGGENGVNYFNGAIDDVRVYNRALSSNEVEALYTIESYPQYFVTNGLVAYYPFNGNANDASGNGNNGTVNGATLTQDRFGNPNSAYSFNGTNSYIGFTNVPTAQVDNWTITAWVQPATLDQTGNAVLVGYDAGVSATADGYSLGITGPGFATPGNQLWGIFDGIGFVNGDFTFTESNQWYQVVMLNNAGVTTFFVNGVPTSTNSITTTPRTPTGFTIGSLNGTNYFNGAIDDVRIYNRALSKNEVEELYGIESAGYCPPTIAQATAEVVNGFVVGATITDPGCGYTNAPAVLIVGGGGSGATATAVFEDGLVVGIDIIDAGSSYTSQPTIEIAAPPSGGAAITNEPQSVAVSAYGTASFSVGATGIEPLSYQWSLNDTNIAGATDSSLTISNVVQTNLGLYSVVVTNQNGTATSSNAMLSMYPFIVTPFTGAVTYWGQSATLSMAAWGTGPLSYQWFDGGVAILNATNQTLDFSSIQPTNGGLYSVVVSSPLGSVTNTPAQVVVNPAGVSLGFYPGLTINGVAGYSYIIQSSTNLVNTNGWVTLTNLTLTQPVQLFIDTTVNASSPFNSQTFYQILPGQP